MPGVIRRVHRIGGFAGAATVDPVFRVAALIPSPLVLIPELAGAAPLTDADHPAAQVPPLRAAVVQAGRRLGEYARNWTVVGAGTGCVAGVGTLRGFGADVRMALSDEELRTGAEPDPRWPVPLLVGAWLRGQVSGSGRDGRGPDPIEAEALAIDPDTDPDGCAALGTRLRARLDGDATPRGVLVVADGAATLSTTSPGYLDPRAEAEQQRIDAALDAGDRAALATLDDTLCGELEVAGRPGYQVLAGLFERDDADPEVETLYRAAPFGVGYHVSLWHPAGTR